MGDPRVTSDDKDHSTRTGVLVAAFSASFLTPYMVSSVNIALPTIALDLKLGAVGMSWVTTAYLLCSTIFLIPFGKLADLYGRKRFFAAGIFIITFSAALSSVAGTGELLIATRMLHGIGSALIFGTSMAMLTSVYPPKKRGKIIGINVSCIYLGLTLGPFLGGMLTFHLGWRSLFWSIIPVGAIIFTVAILFIRSEWREREGGRFDVAGSILYAVSIALVVIGLSKLTQWYGIVLTCLGVLVGGIFIMAELRIPHSILPIGLLLRNRVFACSISAAFINYGATYAVGFLMSLYLQYVKGIPSHKAGMLLIIQPVIMVLFSPLAGRLSDRIESRILSSIGMGCITAGLLLMSCFGLNTSMEFFIGTMSLLGCGFALFSSPNTSAVMGSVEKNNYGVASATVSTMRLLGQIFSMGFTMLIMSIMIGQGTITPQHYPRFIEMQHLISLVFAGISIIGIAVSLVRGNVRMEKTEEVT